VVVRKRVRVHTKDQKTYDGVLIRRRGKWIRLEKASLVEADDRSIPMDGATVIPRENVACIQEL
jgi:hypothetical protein